PTTTTASKVSSVSTAEADAESGRNTSPSKVSKGLIAAGVAAATLLIVLFVWNYRNQKDKSTTATVTPPVTVRSPEQTPTPTPVRSDDNISIQTVSDLVKHLKLKRLTFLLGDCPLAPSELSTVRLLAIDKDELRLTRWYLEFEHPKASRQIDFQIFAKFNDPNGKNRGLMKLEKALIKPNSTHSWFCSERGLSGQRQLAPLPLGGGPPVTLPTGSYKVEFFFRESVGAVTRKVGEYPFSIRSRLSVD
ncbi:MAG TPA: hypothetical protein VF074_06500, partial [Pyrinomonadaceae bacterium]